MPIQAFTDLNSFHAATGYTGRTDITGFHIYTQESTYPSTRSVMPPYTLNAFQLSFLRNSDDASLSVNADTRRGLSEMLFVASPEHVLAWMRGARQSGFHVFFTQDWLAGQNIDPARDFPFFDLSAINAAVIDSEDARVLAARFGDLLNVFAGAHPYRERVLQSLLLVLLYECKRIFDTQQGHAQRAPRLQALGHRFQQLVQQRFLTERTVDAYARMLAITPDYLGQVVKAASGRTPLAVIQERVVIEAKRLLAHTSLSVAEIADYLGYAEPTHFGRFFRNQVGESPSTWRDRHGPNPDSGQKQSEMGHDDRPMAG